MITRKCIFLVLVCCLTGCTTIPKHDEFISSYSINKHHGDVVNISLHTGSIVVGAANTMIAAGGVFVSVPNSGSGNPKWAYGRKDQEDTIQDLRDVLVTNNAFKTANIIEVAQEKKSSHLIKITYHKTATCCDKWWYDLDVSVEIFKEGLKVYSTRNEFESNTYSEALGSTEAVISALTFARHKAKEKVIAMVIKGISESN